MIRIGIQIEPPESSSGPIFSPPTASAMPSAIPSRTTGKRPDHVEGAGDHRVGPAPVVAGEQAEDDRQDRRDQRRDEADEAARCGRRTSAAPSRRGRGGRRRRGRTCRRRRTRRGPIGLPSGSTTSRFSPSTVIFSSVWVVFGPVWATWSAHSGAASTKTTIRTKRPRKASATRLRRKPPEGQVPGAALASAAGSAPRELRRLPPEADRLGLDGHVAPGRRLLEFEAGQVLAEGRVEDDACRG